MGRALRREARANARERAFLAGVTHELRTPLSAIRLFGETLAAGRGDAREYGSLVAQESERLEALVERVLAVTRVDEAPRFSSLAPAALVRSAVALIRPRAERRAVTLETELAEPLPEVTWDEEAVRRALLSLIDNAVKHGRERGRVTVTAAASEPGLVRLAVADDGPGIARREQQAHLRPLHARREHRRGNRPRALSRGAGRRRARRADRPRDGGGARQHLQPRASDRPAGRARRGGLVSARLLLVEDEAGLARGLVDNFRAEGYDVRHVARGDQAAAAVREYRPDVARARRPAARAARASTCSPTSGGRATGCRF